MTYTKVYIHHIWFTLIIVYFPFLRSLLQLFTRTRGAGEAPSYILVHPAGGYHSQPLRPLSSGRRPVPGRSLLSTLSVRVRCWLWSFAVRAFLVVPRSWWFRLSDLLVSVWRWYWCCGAGFRSVCAVVLFVQIVGLALVLVFLALVLVVVFVRWFRFICPFGRRLVLVDPVQIWPKSAKFES